MRTISSELTSAQQAQANSPHVEVVLTKKSNEDTVTYATDDGTNRIIRVRASEEFYGGSLFEISSASGIPLPIACQIILNNSDNAVSAKDLRGYRVDVRWGFSSYVNDSEATVAISGTKYSQGEPFFVMVQREHTEAGVNVTELWCISSWQLLEFRKIMGESLGDIYTNTTGTTRNVVLDSIVDPPDRVFIYDASASTYSSNHATALSRNLFPVTFPFAEDDIFYIGRIRVGTANPTFDRITIELDTAANWVGAFKLQYSIPSAGWADLSGVVDGTSNFETTGVKTISFIKPHFDNSITDHPTYPGVNKGWAAQTIGGVSAYWVRIIQTSWSAVSADAVVRRIGIGSFWGLELGTSDSKENDAAIVPKIVSQMDTSRRTVLREALDYTKMKLVPGEKFWSFTRFVDSPSVVYTYDIDGDHAFFTDVRERTLPIPSKVIVTNILNNGKSNTNQRTGSAEAANLNLDHIVEIILDETIVDSSAGLAYATTRAEDRLARYSQENYQGEITVPMQINQEPWDWIQVNADRLSLTLTGRVGRIIREYDYAAAKYHARISMGENKVLPFSAAQVEPRAGGVPVSDIPPNWPHTEISIDWQEAFREGAATQLQQEISSQPRLVGSPLRTFTRTHTPQFGLGEIGVVPHSVPQAYLQSARSGYSSPKYGVAATSQGYGATDLKTNTLRLASSGYNDVLFYNGGDASVYLEDVGSDTAATILDVGMHIYPSGTGTWDLGTASLLWKDLYITSISSGTITPRTDSTFDLGTSSIRWADVHADNLKVTNIVGNASTIPITGILAFTHVPGVGVGPNSGYIRLTSDNDHYSTTITQEEDQFLLFPSRTVAGINASAAEIPLVLASNGGISILGLTTVTGDILPNADSTRDLGATSKEWAEVWVEEIKSDGVLLINPNTRFVSNLEIDGTLNHDGSSVGFFGTAPASRPTGVAVSAAGIHAALVTLGLITA